MKMNISLAAVCEDVWRKSEDLVVKMRERE